MRARIVAALAAGCLTLAAGTGSASAAPRHGSAETIGGPLLATHGVIVQPGPDAPPLPPTSALPASAWMVTNLTTGEVLAAKDPHGRYLPASTLKVLTADTLIPKLKASTMEPVSYRAATVDGTRVGLVPSMKYSVKTLFTCLLVDSANDAADALAEANGGIRKTVADMNARAVVLQADDTHADTPSGLDGPGESSSAYDLALFAQDALKLPSFRHYIQTLSFKVPAPHGKHFMIYNHNQLLTTYRGDIGVKNGYTVAAQGTEIAAATRHGETILVTLMHAYPDFWPMAKTLMNWGFHATGKVTPVGTLVQPLPPAAPAPPSARPTEPVSLHKAASLTPGNGTTLPWIDVEIAGAALVALTIVSVVARRRRTRRRTYRPRLRLPPI
jgi:D-alanyl-D-alanine carboxypeptidase (penicillin-binding protein 5/6)